MLVARIINKMGSIDYFIINKLVFMFVNPRTVLSVSDFSIELNNWM